MAGIVVLQVFLLFYFFSLRFVGLICCLRPQASELAPTGVSSL